jgi:ATP-dependent DNA ligase
MLQRTFPAGFIAPCLPTKTDKLPSGSQWLHEIKHDGFRIIARKTGAQVRLYSRPGNDLTRRFPLIVETLARLRLRSCIIHGEAVACDAQRRCPVRPHPSKRPRRERPRARAAAEQRDELAPFYLTEMHPIPHGREHIARISEAGPAR